MKHFLGVVLMLGISVVSRSQYVNDGVLTKEVGISLNAMNCNTDIGGQALDVKSFKPSLGVYIGVLYKQKVGARLEGTIGSVTASDFRAIDYNLKARNLDFTSNITEVSLLAEVHPFNFSLQDGDDAPAVSPYLLAGVGYFGFNPRTKLNGQWIDLQPLHTEGEGFPGTGKPNYSLRSFNLPVGAGLQFNISDVFTLRGEAIYRFLNTDYLDDVSTTYINPALFDRYLSIDNAVLAKQLANRSYDVPENDALHGPGGIRGNSQKKDAYYSINVKLGIRLSTLTEDNRPYMRRSHYAF